MRYSAFIFDLLILNGLFLLTCFPLVTHGVAQLALYATLRDLRQGQAASVSRTYLHYCRRYGKRGLLLGITELVLLGIAFLDFYLVKNQTTPAFQVFKLFCLAIGFLSLVIYRYAYPLAIRTSFSLITLWRTCVLLAAYFLPWTIGFLGVMALVFLMLQLSLFYLLIGLSFLAIIGCSSISYLYLIVMEGLFKKLKFD